MNELTFVSYLSDFTSVRAQRLTGAGMPPLITQGVLEERQVDMQGRVRRCDIRLNTRSGRKLVSGEVKRPEVAEGRDPCHPALVQEARRKAVARGLPFYFTCNMAQVALFAVANRAGLPDQKVATCNLAPLSHSRDVEAYLPAIQSSWETFLDELERHFNTLASVARPGAMRADLFSLVGSLYEGLIDQDFRHQLGQYYTPGEVADLLTAFAVRSPGDVVMDPAAGGGSLLRAAYERKRALGAHHESCLATLWGFEITAFAAELSTLSLASADTAAAAACPRVVLEDFFEVRPGQRVPQLPGEVRLPTEFDAIIGNPPYISYRRQTNQPKIVEALRDLSPPQGKRARPPITLPRFSGKSDAYVWFIVHATRFLKQGGRLAFVVSASILFSDYGIPLIRFLGQHYRIRAVIDSRVERWFPDADTHTVLLLLEREEEQQAREANLIRFIRLRRPLAQVLAAERPHPRRELPAKLIDQLLSAPAGGEDPRALVNLVSQGAEGGLAPGVERRWGELLRSEPHLRELISQGLQQGSLVPLRSVATVRGGVVTRANSFFIVEEVPCKEIHPGLAAVKDGLGTLHRLERAWLCPVIKGPERLLSPTEVSESPERLLVVDIDKDKLRRQRATGVLAYLKRGETLSYKVSKDDLKGGIPALRSNIRSRRPYWYSLSLPEVRGARILMPEHLDSRYVATLLSESNPAIVIDKLFIIEPRHSEHAPVLLASLNALLTWYQLELRGRTQLGQGVLELKVPDIGGLAVLNPEGLSKKSLQALLEAFSPLERAREPDSLEAAVKPERVAFDELYLRHAGASAPEEDRLHVERELRAAAAERHERRQPDPLLHPGDRGLRL